MILNEDVQIQLFRQTLYGTVPGTPNGILIPRGSSFAIDYDQNLIDNPQVFADGIEREPALGNKMTGANGDVVPNLAFFPYLQKAICGNNVTTGAGPYVHTSTGISRTALLHLFELGLIPLNLFYRFFDMVMSEFHLKCTVEGILSIGTKWGATGKVTFPPNGTSLDATPTEITGSAVNYVDAVLLENGADAGDLVELDIDVVTRIVEKRVTGKAGEATQLVRSKAMVSGTADFFFETDARFARARAGTLTTIQATINAGADTSVISLNEVKLKPVGPKQEGEDGIRQKFAFKAIRKTDLTNTPIKFVTTNTTATID